MTLHNVERYVEESLRSVLSDPYPLLEVLVLDDGSTDATLEIVRRVAGDDKRVRIERSEGYLGLGKARARMVELSNAEYLVPFDGDDIFMPGRIQRQVAALERNPDVAGVYGKAKRINADGSAQGTSIGFAFSSFYLPFANPICHGASMIRRSVVIEAGNYLETGQGVDSIAEDHFLWLRIAQRWKILFENEFRYFYRCHDQQTSTTKAAKSDACAAYARQYLRDANQSLVAELMKGGSISFTRSDIPRIMLVLGLLCHSTDPRSVGHQSILKIAEQMEPDDYGVLIRKHIQFAALGDAPRSLQQCALLRERYPHDLFLCLAACEDEIALLRQIPATPPEKLAGILALRDDYTRRFHHGPVAIDK